jgi:hypothetical protein
MNEKEVQRRLATIDPLFEPTRSVLALREAVSFVAGRLAEKQVAATQETQERIASVRMITRLTILDDSAGCLERIQKALVAIQKELSNTEALANVRIPESIVSIRFDTAVIALANSLLGIILGLSLYRNDGNSEDRG